MRVTKDPEIRRQELVQASLELFLDKGYEKTSVKDIVAAVGVAQGLFYYYFPSKEDILKEIADYYVEVLIGSVEISAAISMFSLAVKFGIKL